MIRFLILFILIQLHWYSGAQVSNGKDLLETETRAIRSAGLISGDMKAQMIQKEHIRENLSFKVVDHSLTSVGSTQKRVLVEDLTGTWCGFCVMGNAYLEYLKEKLGDIFIGVAIHDNDPMMNNFYANQFIEKISEVANTGAVDRIWKPLAPTEYEERIVRQMEETAPADLSIKNRNWDPDSRILVFDVEAVFYKNFTGHFRFNAILTEDSVTGTSTGYSQNNVYAGGGLGTMFGYENLPNPIPFNQMVYNHVARAILGGWNGVENSLPDTVFPGISYTRSFSVNLSPVIRESNLNIIGLIIDADHESVANAVKNNHFTGVTENPAPDHVKVFPNPSSNLSFIEFFLPVPSRVEFVIYSLQGREIKKINENFLNAGKQILSWDGKNNHGQQVPPGLYGGNLMINNHPVSFKIFRMDQISIVP